MRIGVFEINFNFRTSFVLAEVCSGRANLFRMLEIRNVRGTTSDWVNLYIEISGIRTRHKAVRNLAVGDETTANAKALEIRNELTVPANMGPGTYNARLLIEDENGEEKSEFTFRVFPAQVIPTDFPRAVYLSAYIHTSDTLRQFVAGVLGNRKSIRGGQALKLLYEALSDRQLLYHPVPVTYETDCQEIADYGYILKKGGSCADLSLLIASLLWTWGIPPVLLLFSDHMAAGCFDTEGIPDFEVMEDSEVILALIAQGILKVVECTELCSSWNTSDSELSESIIQHIKQGDHCALVNVRQALRNGISPVPEKMSPYIVCPNCMYDRFVGDISDRMRCPCCGYIFSPNTPSVLPEQLSEPIVYSTSVQYCLSQGSAAVLKLASPHEECVRISPVWQSFTVRRICDRAFDGDDMKRMILPNTITHIGDYAFHGCISLKKIVLPEDLMDIGTGAFSGSGLTEIIISHQVKRIPRLAFSQCKALEKVMLQDGIQYIDEGAFTGCELLHAVHIPRSVLKVSANAFDSGCELHLEGNRTMIV